MGRIDTKATGWLSTVTSSAATRVGMATGMGGLYTMKAPCSNISRKRDFLYPPEMPMAGYREIEI